MHFNIFRTAEKFEHDYSLDGPKATTQTEIDAKWRKQLSKRQVLRLRNILSTPTAKRLTGNSQLGKICGRICGSTKEGSRLTRYSNWRQKINSKWFKILPLLGRPQSIIVRQSTAITDSLIRFIVWWHHRNLFLSNRRITYNYLSQSRIYQRLWEMTKISEYQWYSKRLGEL